MEADEKISNSTNDNQSSEGVYSRSVLIEGLETAVKKTTFYCSEHEKETAVFCLTCKQSICAACREFNHTRHFYLNKAEFNLDDLEKNPERFLCTKIEDDSFELMNVYKEKVEEDFIKIKNSIEVAKQERLKEIELCFLGYENYKDNLREEIKKNIDAFTCFCESYRGILTREAIKLNDTSFLQVYELLNRGSNTNKDIINLLAKKKEELDEYLEKIKETNEKFEKTINENLGFPLLFSFLSQTEKTTLKTINTNYVKEPELNEEKNVESPTQTDEKKKKNITLGKSSDKIVNENTLLELQEFLRQNCNYMENFIKEIKTVRNNNTFCYTNSMSRIPEINLVGIPDSKLYSKAFLKFIKSSGEGLENLVSQLPIYSIKPIFKENRTRSLSSNKKTTLKSFQSPDARKKSSLKKTSTLTSCKNESSKKETFNLNKYSYSIEGEYTSENKKGSKIFLLQDGCVTKENNNSPVKTVSYTNKMMNDKGREKFGIYPAPVKTFNRDDMLYDLKIKSKSSLKEKKSKNESPSKRSRPSLTIKKLDSEFTRNHETLNHTESMATKTKMRSRISDHIIKTLMYSNIKLKNDPLKLINQYLAANPNITNINDFTIKNIMEQIFNNDCAKPVEGKNEIQLYDFKNSKITKKEINLTKSAHGCTSFLNALRYLIIKDKLYMIGGRDWSQQHNICLCYDIKSESISRLTDMNKARSYCSLITSEDEKLIYAIGGVENNTCEVYNIEAGIWTTLPKMNFARGNSYLYIYKGSFLYVFSGFKGEFSGNQYVEHIERLNLSDPKAWELMQYKNSSLIDMHFPYSGVIPISEGHILIYGEENSRYQKKCEVIYDLNKNEIFNAGDKLDSIRKEKLTDYQATTESIKV
jgi:hypothetical protein